MTQELLSRVHRELLDVLNSINQDKIHHDGDDFHELLNDVEKALAQPEQEPVAWLEPEWGKRICPEVGFEATITSDHPRDLCWIPLYPHPPQRIDPLIGCVNHDCDKCKEKNT